MRAPSSPRPRAGRVVACAFALGGLVVASEAASACSNGQCGNAATSYVVFQPNGPTSAIPLCTGTAADGPFAGAPPLSAQALAQCTAICPSASFFMPEGGTNPCCLSQWEAQTVVCAPPCSP